MATRVPSTAAANISIHSTMPGDAREASRQNRRRACPRAIYGAVGWTLADNCDLRRRIPGQCQPEAMAGHDVTAIEVGEHEGGRIGVRHDHPGNQGRGDRQEQRARQGTAAQLISASCPLTRSSGTRALRSPVSPTPVQGPRAAAWPACGRTP
jgi:hypothetical protein